jgi:hypothetical protein
MSIIYEEDSLFDFLACDFNTEYTALDKICNVLNRAAPQDSFVKLNLVPADFEFTGDSSLTSTFIKTPDSKDGDVKKAEPRVRKLQRALTYALHEDSLSTFMDMVASDRHHCDDRERDLHLAHLRAVSAPDSSQFLKIVPTDKSLCIPNDAFAFTLRARLALPLVNIDQIPERCFCDELLPDHPFTSYHFLFCKELKGGPRYAMHQNIVAELKKYCQDSGIHSSTHSTALLADPDNHHPYGKRPDLLIYLPRGYPTIAIDASLTCPVAESLYPKYNRPLAAAVIREQYKKSKYQERCKKQRLSFAPFVLEVFGGIGADAVELINTIFKASRVKCSRKTFRRMLHITLITSAYKMFTTMLDRARAQRHVTFRPAAQQSESDLDLFRPASEEPESEPDLKHTDDAEPVPHTDTTLTTDVNCTQPSSPSSPPWLTRTVSSTIPDSPDIKEVILDLISAPAQAPPVTPEDSVSDASLPLESQSSISSTASPDLHRPASQEPESEPVPDLKHKADAEHPGAIALETDRMLALDSVTSTVPPPPLRRSQRRSGKTPGE